MESLREYNELQEEILGSFIDAGGRLRVVQEGRGKGYTTFVIVQCLQQLLTTDRAVVFIDDLKNRSVTIHMIVEVAVFFFNIAADQMRVNQARNQITIGDKTLQILNPNYINSVRGITIDDVYGDVEYRTTVSCSEFFYTLNSRQARDNTDGRGMSLLVVR